MLNQWHTGNKTVDFCYKQEAQIGDEVLLVTHQGIVQANILSVEQCRQAKPHHPKGIMWQRVKLSTMAPVKNI